MTPDDALPETELPSSSGYLRLLRDAEKAFQPYFTTAKNVDERYASLSMGQTSGDREFKIFWANLEVLRPALYSRPPLPVVMPRHKDGNQRLFRKAAEMLERVLTYDVEADDLHETLLLVRDDLAISGRGVAWVLDTGACLHVDRDDFLHDPARKWAEIGWIARRAYLTRGEVQERFPRADVAKMQFKADTDANGDYRTTPKAQVWELWHRGEGKVVWVSHDYPTALDVQPPPIAVKGFFPCPKPVYGTVERGKLLPVPDLIFYRDQVDEINELTARISSLSESLRLKGFYAGGGGDLAEAIETAIKDTGNRATLVPVASLGALGGRVSDAIMWLPVEQVAVVVRELVTLRRQLMQDVYEITGLSDIMRGATDAGETATAQNLKAQFGSVRVRERQNEMVRIARDVLRIKGEIFAENVPGAELAQMAQMDLTPTEDDPTTLEEIDALLKQDRLRPFVLDIESDSTIAPDEEADKASRMEFLGAMGEFLQRGAPLAMQAPEMGPMLAAMLKFTAGSFRSSRELGTEIDAFTEQIKTGAKQQPQGPSPEQMQMEADAQAKQADMQMRQADMQAKAQQAQAELALKQQVAQADAQMKQADLAMRQQQMQAELALKREELNLKRMDMQMRGMESALSLEDRVAGRGERDKDRGAQEKQAMVAAGLPPGYSFDDDRAQFKAVQDQITKSDAATREVLAAVQDGQTKIADAVKDMATAMAAPKRVVRDETGQVTGVTTGAV